MTAATTDKKIKDTVNLALKKVVERKFETDFFEQLCLMEEFIHDGTDYSEKKYFFTTLNQKECKKVKSLLQKELYEKITNEDLSYLQTMRIFTALDVLGFKIKTCNNKKVKFCAELYKKAPDFPLRTIALLDN